MTNEDKLGKDREFTRDAIIKKFDIPKPILGSNKAIKGVEITIDAKAYSPTELLLQIQALNFRDPEINTKLAVTLRKIADGIDSHKMRFTRIANRLNNGADLYPTATLELDFMDIEHFDKGLAKIKKGN